MTRPLLFGLLFATSSLLSQQPPNIMAVMCTEATPLLTEKATCTGSASCRACKNCGYCGHCAKRGGSCGVCSRGRRTTTRSQSLARLPAARSSEETTPNDRVADQPSSEYYLKTLVVKNTTSLNLRTGPGSGYDIIRRLRHSDRMTLLAIQNGWVKVRLAEGNLIGYVSSNYVAVL